MKKKIIKEKKSCLEYRYFILQQQEAKLQKRKEKYEGSDFSKSMSFERYIAKESYITQSRLKQVISSESKLMRKNEDRTELLMTFTFSKPHRIADTDKSFDAISQKITQQNQSAKYFIRKIGKSNKFRGKESKECAYKNPLHYHWSLELQSSTDIHMHAIVTLYDNIDEVEKFILLIHSMRNRYHDVLWLNNGSANERKILPLGRTHLSLSAHLKTKLLERFKKRGIEVIVLPDKKNPNRKNYFLPSLSPKINIYEGNGTVLEFNDTKTLTEKYSLIRKYVMSLNQAKYKLQTIQTSLSIAQRKHNLKGKFENDESRASEDIAIFEYLGIKLHGSTQMLFPISLYQKIRKQLIKYNNRYDNLKTVTLHWCQGIIRIVGKNNNRKILNNKDEVIAIEPKKEKVKFEEPRNQYKVAKEGL